MTKCLLAPSSAVLTAWILLQVQRRAQIRENIRELEKQLESLRMEDTELSQSIELQDERIFAANAGTVAPEVPVMLLGTHICHSAHRTGNGTRPG